MTTKEKIILVSNEMDHLFYLYRVGVLSDDELQYLYDEFRHLRQYLTELRSIELQEGGEEK